MYKAGPVLNDGVIVTDNYEMGESPYIWIDAIVMPLAEYEALTQEEIYQIKLSRYQAWYEFVTKPEPDPDPVPPEEG
jgi:hypothetical protein